MKSIKKIGVVTATRAEYGLLVPLLHQLKSSKIFELQLFVTGTHLSYEFGYTANRIKEDGFVICEKIDTLISNDTASSIGKTSALTLMGLVDAFERQTPDLVVILGDRYEMLSTAMAANICRIPIAHLHGGEITEGAYDDGFRHAITKLSHIHFTSSEEHKNRVLQMGEDPKNVFNVGAIGIDNIKNISPLSQKDLEDNLGIKFKKHNILVTIHPETLEKGSSEKNVIVLLESLSKLKDTFIIFTGSNADSEGRIINKLLKDFSNTSESSFFIESLGQLRYISILYIVNAVVGNSSSGIIEVPSFKIPTINIGLRQKGRMRADSVVDVNWNSKEITESILSSFISDSSLVENPYGIGNTANKIIEKLSNIKNYKTLIKKIFKDEVISEKHIN